MSDTINTRKDVSNLTTEEAAKYGMKALKKIEAYMVFYMKLDTGAEISTVDLLKIRRRIRYMEHRLATLKKAGDRT